MLHLKYNIYDSEKFILVLTLTAIRILRSMKTTQPITLVGNRMIVHRV